VLQQQAALEEMADSLAVVARVVEQELQLVVLAVKVRQVKLEFGVGNDTKQHNTNT
jgi:hypothetical protein